MATSDTNYRLFGLPGVGELTAYSLGTASVYQANTPVSYYLDSLDRIGAFFQDQPGRISPSSPGVPGVPGIGESIPQGQTIDDLRARLKKVRDDAQRKIDEISGKAPAPTPSPTPGAGGGVSIWDVLKGRTVRSGGPATGPTIGSKPMISDAGGQAFGQVGAGDCGMFDYICQFQKMDAAPRFFMLVLGIGLVWLGVKALR